MCVRDKCAGQKSSIQKVEGEAKRNSSARCCLPALSGTYVKEEVCCIAQPG